jgi:hypothetical protein
MHLGVQGSRAHPDFGREGADQAGRLAGRAALQSLDAEVLLVVLHNAVLHAQQDHKLLHALKELARGAPCWTKNDNLALHAQTAGEKRAGQERASASFEAPWPHRKAHSHARNEHRNAKSLS